MPQRTPTPPNPGQPTPIDAPALASNNSTPNHPTQPTKNEHAHPTNPRRPTCQHRKSSPSRPSSQPAQSASLSSVNSDRLTHHAMPPPNKNKLTRSSRAAPNSPIPRRSRAPRSRVAKQNPRPSRIHDDQPDHQRWAPHAAKPDPKLPYNAANAPTPNHKNTPIP